MTNLDRLGKKGYKMHKRAFAMISPNTFTCRCGRLPRIWVVLLALAAKFASRVEANPAGGTVTQGSATFNNSGSQLTIQTSDHAFINWQSFNIGLGQTTTFQQPSSSSVVWNQINDANPSQILGNLNANGYVVLQNSAGFYIGGKASITAQGLVMTTAPIAMPDLNSGGAWQFSAPPPTISIVNYGQLNIGRGGSAYLIADVIENHGSITAPEGNIGLYAGKDVLLSQRPDGRGLSALVTLPEGSVDNSGSLIADGGTIALHAQVVNQGGLIQANSIQDLKGTIELVASDAVNLSAVWNLADSGGAALLTLAAGNKITLNNGSAINAGHNWSVSLSAGPQNLSSSPAPLSDAIYLKGNSFIQTQNGNISLWAANEIIVQNGAVRTLGGGSISATAEFGNVNTGNNLYGYIFGQLQQSLNNNLPPFYQVDTTRLGGISTAAGGDVTITAGGNVTSYLPTQQNHDDNNSVFCAGTGAFGPQAGNVTITAGGNVFGNYVLANGVGSITANGDIGSRIPNKGFALSLIKGSWGVFAPHGNIYLQDVLNPNGIFDDVRESNQSDAQGNTLLYSGYHFFDYDPHASVLLNAANSVEITGAGAPLTLPSGESLPILLPPSLEVITGSGGFVLDRDVTLFPSAFGELHITTHAGGNFQSLQDPTNPQDVNVFRLQMSDSGSKQWLGNESFGLGDHATTPPELNNFNPVEISISGSVNNVNLYTTKVTHMTVGGDMINSGFVGENLHPGDITHPGDKTSVNVAGKISYSPIYYFAPKLGQAIVGADPLHPSDWASIFTFLVDNDKTASLEVPANTTLASLRSLANSLLVFHGTLDPIAPEGFVYDLATLQLGYQYQMSSFIRSALEGYSTVSALNGKLQIIKLDQLGNPVIQAGQSSLGQDPNKFYFATTTVSFVPTSVIETLYNNSLKSLKDASSLSPGFQIGGPGEFNITAASLDLGASGGILSWGRGNGSLAPGGINYGSVPGTIGSGATINLTVDGDIGMLTSTIASFDGGDVNVTSTGGKIDLGLASLPLHPSKPGNAAYGIYTSGHSNVKVIADKDINIQSARIAAFNGGNIFVESLTGDVNAGNGANEALVVPVVLRDLITGLLTTGSIRPKPFGSGILAISPTAAFQTPGGNGLPGNITVNTPQGDIVSALGGISQYALNGSIAGGPTITLTAGTPASGGSPAIPGNILLGGGGVIGGTVNITAQGNVEGLIISRQNSSIHAAQNFNGTLLSGGLANLTAVGTIVGKVVGIGGVNAAGGQGVTADVLGQNVSINGGASQSTLGTAATASSSSQSAAQQSTSEAHEQVAATNAQDDDANKKSKGPVLVKRTGRVTVILPSKS
jgi:filamentous hemagglutinin family protein